MTTQTETRIASGRVERIANSRRSFYLNGNRMFTQSNNDASEMPPVGAAIRVEYKPWASGDGQRTVNYYSRWDFDMSASADGPSRQLENAPQSRQDAPQGLRDDRPVVTRLACLGRAIETLAGTGADEGTILMLAEKYVAWATFGGKDKPADDPEA